jgi:hypothetical protein
MAAMCAVDGPAADVNGIPGKEDDDDIAAFDRETAMTTGKNLFRHGVELPSASGVPRRGSVGSRCSGVALTNVSQVGRFTGTAD